jgi:hypothetical protein
MFGDKWADSERVAGQAGLARYLPELAAIQQFEKAQKEIARLCESGELQTALRPEAGGQMTDVPAHWWNTERWKVRFVMCQMTAHNPFGMGFAGEGYCWIFVTRTSLDRFLLGAKSPSPEAERATLPDRSGAPPLFGRPASKSERGGDLMPIYGSRPLSAEEARSPKKVAAQAAINACYPNGVPPSSDLPNTSLCAAVWAWLKEKKPGMPTISDDTILCAAGRRKLRK